MPSQNGFILLQPVHTGSECVYTVCSKLDLPAKETPLRCLFTVSASEATCVLFGGHFPAIEQG